MKITLGLLAAVFFLTASCQLPSASSGEHNLTMSLTIPFLKSASAKASNGRFITGTAGEKITLSASTGSTVAATQVLDSNNNVTGYTAALTVPPVSGIVITAQASANGVLFASGSATVDAKSANPSVNLTLIPVPNAYNTSGVLISSGDNYLDFAIGQVYVFSVEAGNTYMYCSLSGDGQSILSGNLSVTDAQGVLVSLDDGQGNVVYTTGYNSPYPSFYGYVPSLGNYYIIIYSTSAQTNVAMNLGFGG